jgi:NTE family protein
LALLEWGMHLAAQIDELRAGGSRVETILPEATPATHSAASDGSIDASAPCRAGCDQGGAVAEKLTEILG